MSDDTGKVDEILDELDLGEDVTGTPTESVEDDVAVQDEDSEPEDRLSMLHEAGALTDEEYEVLQARLGNGDEGIEEENSQESSTVPEFGKQIATSEGTEMDFSILGVFEDVDTTKLATPGYADAVDQDELPPMFQGGPGRTLVFWQIHNHSDRDIKLKHDNFEWIGDDQIAYNQKNNPLHEDRLEPGWRTDKVYVAADTRIKYASGVEMPVPLAEIKINGYCSDVHDFALTDDMRFPSSDLPATVDL